jgi:hypothetical protein
MQFLAYCPFCEKKVSVATTLGGDNLDRALACDDDVKVGHSSGIPTEGDHSWNLIRQEKENLRKHIAFEKQCG